MEMRERGRYRVAIEGAGFSTLTINLPVPGRFNGVNAALAAVSASNIGIGHAVIEDALEHFEGIERRLELLTRPGVRPVFSDYAHHPTEIEATLQALKEEFPGMAITLIFQPHQHSRTKHFFNDFMRVLQEADRLVLTEVYRQREGEDAELTMNSSLLYEKLKPLMGERVVLIEDKGKIPAYLQREGGSEEVLLFMGAGDIDEVAREFSSEQ
jgi:UDP-N-acetylmuramate--alanine ligase